MLWILGMQGVIQTHGTCKPMQRLFRESVSAELEFAEG